MTDNAMSAAVPLAQREALLANLLPFAVVPAEARAALATLLREERYAPGHVVVAQGEVGETLNLIAEGQATVSLSGPAGPVILRTLGAGELFGELALLTPTHRRQATVTALTPLLVLSLPAAAFDDLLDTYPLARTIFTAAAEALVVATFLKTASPFSTLDAAHLRRLAARLKPLSVAAGTTIVRQGQRWGYACYLLRSGRVEVVREDDAGERPLATLGPGTLFGEAALLTEVPRTATVRALEPCELLVLHQPELLKALAADRRLDARIHALLHQQDHPRPALPGHRPRLLARLFGRR